MPPLSSRLKRAVDRLANDESCAVSQGPPCSCAVAKRLAALHCQHTGFAGVCRWCLADALVPTWRGQVMSAHHEAAQLEAAARLMRWRARRRREAR